MNAAKPWLLKVLNGPNAGAQILISKEVIVGTSLESDLILNDPHVSPIHCQIKKGEEEGFSVMPRDGAIFINGVHVEEAENLLKLGDVLTLGSTHLTGGPSDQLWPPVKIPEIQEIGVIPKEASASQAASVTETFPPANPKEAQTTSKISLVVLIVVGICIFAGLLLFKFVAHKNLMIPRASFQPATFDKEDQQILQSKRSIAEAQAKELQKKFPQNNIKVVETSEGCTLYIYVHDQLQSDHVRKIMNESSVPIVCNIINISDIMMSGRAMMEAMHLSIFPTVDENSGKVCWNGYLPNEALLESVKKQIARDLPAITEQEFNIILGEAATKQVRAILMKHYFGNITVTPERENITLTGTVSMAEGIRWEQALEALEQEFHGNVKFSNMVTISTSNVKTTGFFNAPVVSISISSSPYAILQNGERIFLGARTNNGYIVTSITPKGLEITNHGEKKIIPLAGQSLTSESNIRR